MMSNFYVEPYFNNIKFYSISSFWNHPISKTEIFYADTSEQISLKRVTNYNYSNSEWTQLSSFSTANSDDKWKTTTLKYPYDFSGEPVLTRMVENNQIAKVVERIDSVSMQHAFSTKTHFNFWNNNSWGLSDSAAIIVPQYIETRAMNYPSFEERIRNQMYDHFGNLKSALKLDNIVHSYLWDYSDSYPVAEIINASPQEVSYTSFETSNMGNWYFDGARIYYSTAPTGRMVYDLSTGEISKENIDSTENYILTYWSDSGVYRVNNSDSGMMVSSAGKWKCFSHEVHNISSIIISGNGLIDEVRLYPAISRMSTLAYRPLVGILTKCDEKNIIQRYDYDGFRRLVTIRDQDGNILKKYCYNYAGQRENCMLSTIAAWQPTGQSRCKPCAADSNYNVDVLQVEEMDMNPGSETYSQLRWRDTDSSGTCTISADWQNTTTALRCQTASGNNTGYQEQEQKDMNPCSSTYNQTRWITAGYDSTSCPLPVVCSTGNCNIKGPDYKCVNGNCERGTKVITDAYYSSAQGGNICVYHYEWSDGSWSSNYSQFTGIFMCSPF